MDQVYHTTAASRTHVGPVLLIFFIVIYNLFIFILLKAFEHNNLVFDIL